MDSDRGAVVAAVDVRLMALLPLQLGNGEFMLRPQTLPGAKLY